MSEAFKKGFLKTLWILKEYLPVIIIGGGWQIVTNSTKA
jgi:hypothetical protein